MKNSFDENSLKLNFLQKKKQWTHIFISPSSTKKPYVHGQSHTPGNTGTIYLRPINHITSFLIQFNSSIHEAAIDTDVFK